MRIQVATLNVWALPEPFAPAVLPRMAAIGEGLVDFSADVVALQEVWTAAARDVLLEAGARAGYPHHWVPEDAIGGSGLLVLSRLPVLESHFERYALSGYLEELDNGEYLSGKGFARLRLQGDDGPISILNTHLHARYRKRAEHQFASHRIGQIIQLASRVREIEEPVVIVGDFNFADDRPEYRVLTGLTGARDAAVEYGDPLPTVLWTNPYRKKKKAGAKPGKRIDYVFLRDGSEHALKTVEVERIFDESLMVEGSVGACSNHAGVLADLNVVPVERSARHYLSEKAIDLAASLLSEGREEAERRRSESRALSGIGMAFAVLAAAGGRSKTASRRRFMQRSLRAAAVAALTPGIGGSVMSEVVLPNELDAFDVAEQHLDQLGQHASVDAGELPS